MHRAGAGSEGVRLRATPLPGALTDDAMPHGILFSLRDGCCGFGSKLRAFALPCSRRGFSCKVLPLVLAFDQGLRFLALSRQAHVKRQVTAAGFVIDHLHGDHTASLEQVRGFAEGETLPLFGFVRSCGLDFRILAGSIFAQHFLTINEQDEAVIVKNLGDQGIVGVTARDRDFFSQGDAGVAVLHIGQHGFVIMVAVAKSRLADGPYRCGRSGLATIDPTDFRLMAGIVIPLHEWPVIHGARRGSEKQKKRKTNHAPDSRRSAETQAENHGLLRPRLMV